MYFSTISVVDTIVIAENAEEQHCEGEEDSDDSAADVGTVALLVYIRQQIHGVGTSSIRLYS